MPANRTPILKLAGAAALAAAVLAACGGGGGSSTPAPIAPPVQPPAGQTLQSMFGAGFAFIFERDRLADPVDPSAADVIAVNAAADPLDVPDPR